MISALVFLVFQSGFQPVAFNSLDFQYILKPDNFKSHSCIIISKENALKMRSFTRDDSA